MEELDHGEKLLLNRRAAIYERNEAIHYNLDIVSRVRNYDESKGRKPFRPNMDLIESIRGDREEKVRKYEEE